MCSALSLIFIWIRTNEQSLAIWLEGFALVAIFFLEWKEYRRQGEERVEQHEESAAQMAILKSQADASKDNAIAAKEAAEAARLSAQAVLNSERAWIEIRLGPPENDPRDEDNNIFYQFICSIQIENHGRTIAQVESVQVGSDAVKGPLPEEPLNSQTRYLHSLLGSGQKATVGGFDADSGFSDGESILDGTKTGILRIVVKYRDVIDTSILHETSAVYIFQNSLEDEPEKVSSLSVYT